MATIRIPASTTNLGPGFDALGLALSLHNEVTIEEAGSTAIDVTGEGAGSVIRDERNLAYRAALACLEAAGERARPLRVLLNNSIPVSRGLGSSATAIIGGLLGANALCSKPVQTDRLLALACHLEGHPDNVTPALLGGFQVACQSEGEVIHLRLPSPDGLRVVLAIPERGLSTERARAVLPAVVPRQDAVFNVGRACLLVGALTQGRPDLLGVAMEDRLHQPHRSQLLPGFERALQAARAAGAAGACLSGAGSTLLAFTTRDEARVGEAMCVALGEHGVSARALSLVVDEDGAKRVAG